jgi:predicted DNA-binding transcriptional regulator YafY
MEPVGGWGCCVCDAIREQGGPMGLMPASPRESLLPLALEEALEQRCAVMMEYLDARQNRTHRLVEPLFVRRSGGELLLIAWCHMRNDRRTFKLERIVQMTRAEKPEPVTTPAAVQASEVVGEAAPIVLDDLPRRAEPLPAALAEAAPGSSAEPMGDGSPIIVAAPCPANDVIAPEPTTVP